MKLPMWSGIRFGDFFKNISSFYCRCNWRCVLLLFYVFMVKVTACKTLTSVEVKPIAATMTRTTSTAGYELGLLSAFVIYFVLNYIAKGFALGMV